MTMNASGLYFLVPLVGDHFVPCPSISYTCVPPMHTSMLSSDCQSSCSNASANCPSIGPAHCVIVIIRQLGGRHNLMVCSVHDHTNDLGCQTVHHIVCCSCVVGRAVVLYERLLLPLAIVVDSLVLFSVSCFSRCVGNVYDSLNGFSECIMLCGDITNTKDGSDATGQPEVLRTVHLYCALVSLYR